MAHRQSVRRLLNAQRHPPCGCRRFLTLCSDRSGPPEPCWKEIGVGSWGDPTGLAWHPGGDDRLRLLDAACICGHRGTRTSACLESPRTERVWHYALTPSGPPNKRLLLRDDADGRSPTLYGSRATLVVARFSKLSTSVPGRLGAHRLASAPGPQQNRESVRRRLLSDSSMGRV